MTGRRETSPALFGVLFGFAASIGWGIYNVGVDIGRMQGFSTADLTLLRYLGGCVVMTPLMLLLRKPPLRALSIARLAVLTCVAGPPFALFFTVGFSLAPLSHAVVISPGMTMVVASGLSRFVDGNRLSGARHAGMALLIVGLVIIASDSGDGAQETRAETFWIGDLCFVASGSCWGIFTWLMSRWKLDPVSATGAIAIASSIIFAPIYLLVATPTSHEAGRWAMQFFYQGMLGGALAIVWYSAAIKRLGAAAGVFPALVPPFAILLSIPLTGNAPNLVQITGIAAASLGLLVSLNLATLRPRGRARSPDRERVSR